MHPVLVIAYKRADKLEKCLDALSVVAPPRVYIAVDGPRLETDCAAIDAVRTLVSNLPWACQVFHRFADTNHGCRRWVSSSISWFFEQEEFGVVLEEDIVVSPRFFTLCSALEHIRDTHPEIMQINAFDPVGNRGECAFARKTLYITSWGWASWRDAWAKYDDSMNGFFSNSAWTRFEILRSKLGFASIAAHYFLAFLLTRQEKNSSWAYRWALSIWMSDGVALAPGINLSRNVGTGVGASHTSAEHYLDDIYIDDAEGVVFSCKFTNIDREMDREVFSLVTGSDRWLRTLRMLFSVFTPRKVFFGVRRRLRD